ncbi:MAG: cysteine desulfurase [Desulfobacteraceae bacterium]|nr:MAG: cysteine desulfurase [Desulfobacteraceae bacterium]
MIRPIYLDYNGTTPHDPEVIEAMRPFLETEFGNPSSTHWYGIEPKKAVERARRQVADLLNCTGKEVIFTSGGTESNNHAIQGVARARRDKGNHIVTTTFEHPAVLEVCRDLERRGWEVDYVPVDSSGMVDLSDIEKAVRSETVLITVMFANNEVGTVQPIHEISKIARSRGILMHTDASQAVGKIPADVSELEVDLLTIAGHKLYAPKGVGALYVREGVLLDKFCHGAGQEMGIRAGTENVLEIVGLGKACEIAARDLPGQMIRIQALRDRLWGGFSERLGEIRLNGHPTKRLPNTLSISFKGLEADRILEEIGLEVAASAGAACHSDRVEISHVLQAMKIPPEWAQGTIRFSAGRMTTTEEIEKTIRIVASAVNRLRGFP